jgi:hypothetical protein
MRLSHQTLVPAQSSDTPRAVRAARQLQTRRKDTQKRPTKVPAAMSPSNFDTEYDPRIKPLCSHKDYNPFEQSAPRDISKPVEITPKREQRGSRSLKTVRTRRRSRLLHQNLVPMHGPGALPTNATQKLAHYEPRLRRKTNFRQNPESSLREGNLLGTEV